MPGGPPVEVDRLRGEFYSQMIEMVRGVMMSWQEAWKDQGDTPLEDVYSSGAVMHQPGGIPLKGREALREFASTALPFSRDVTAGMYDLEATEGMAFFSGAYAIQPSRADRGPNTGTHFTVIALERDEWVIRAQFFQWDTASASFQAIMAGDAMEPLTNEDVRSARRGDIRFAAYSDAQFLMLAFRDAWSRGDALDAAGFFDDDAMVILPGDAPNRTSEPLPHRLEDAFLRYPSLLTVDLDFDQRDRLCYTFGRYHAQGRDGADKPGHFMIVLKNDGREWKVRALVFS
jgi:hypothetical protein